MIKFCTLILFSFLSFYSCIVFQKGEAYLRLKEENLETVNVSYSYDSKICNSSFYYSGDELNLWTREKILEDTFIAVGHKIKFKNKIYNFHKFPRERIHINIKLYQRYGCLFEYNYSPKELLNDIWLIISGSTLYFVPYYGTSGIVSEVSMKIDEQIISKEEYLLPVNHISFILLFPYSAYNFISNRNEYKLPEILNSIEKSLSKLPEN